MTCPRCNTRMMHVETYEHEEISGSELVTRLVTDECPQCSVAMKFIWPLLPSEMAR